MVWLSRDETDLYGLNITLVKRVPRAHRNAAHYRQGDEPRVKSWRDLPPS